MYTIKLLNEISPVVNRILTDRSYNLTRDAKQYEAILVRSADMHALDLPESLLAIARAGAGVNNIPIDPCSEKGIVVFNTPGANANAVKELVVCGMLLAGRRIVPGIEWVSNLAAAGGCNIEAEVEKGKKQFIGPELEGKKLGVVGLGAVGALVANAGIGLEMDVLGYDPYMSVEAAWSLRRTVRRASSLEQVFSTCDYISLHLPLNDQTKHLIGHTALQAMKPGAVLLNFARGPLVDDNAVKEALDSGHLRCYVTDFPNEAICAHEGVIALPHLGASTPESEDNCAVMAAERLRDYLEDGNIRGSVNFPDCVLPRTGSFRMAIVNRNITNMVGQITALLACEGNNIDHMLNKSRGNWAYTLIDLSQRPTADCVEKLLGIDGVVRVRLL
jgi:D-3-phosphoglycerate dehydrogenase